MKPILNITNGDSAVAVMKTAGIPGRLLPWRDVLHDGPVPANLSLEKLSEVRAGFIVVQGWGDSNAVRNSFAERDKELQSYRNYSKVILWFEHDLYDQLQLLQILDWFYKNPPERTKLTIICTEHYLGMATPEQMKGLLKFEEAITENHMLIAKKAWKAFRSPSPEEWQQLLNEETSILPFLGAAVLRLLEEYPDCKNGLSRTAHRALDIIANGEKKPETVFRHYQDTEERRFLGDLSFWAILNQFLESNPPLIASAPEKKITLPIGPDQELSITLAGREVLAGKRNWLDMNVINRWVGGNHLTPDNLWCWNPASNVLIKMA
jgi:hypothetical protein